MDSWRFVVAVVVGVASLASCAPQYHGQQQYNDQGHYKAPPAAILSHKQALGHDGSFKYSFAADNGLQQGESIAPDGSRIGSYSYVDPKGKTITVNYKADKNGFHVQGDHLPKPVQPIHPVPAAAAPVYHQHEAPSYGGYGAAQFPSHQFSAPAPAPRPYYQAAATNHGDYDEDYEERQDPSKPHSFGDGYSFQIGG